MHDAQLTACNINSQSPQVDITTYKRVKQHAKLQIAQHETQNKPTNPLFPDVLRMYSTFSLPTHKS